MNKIKYLIEKYKEAKEWNQKQTGGTRSKAYFTTRSTLSWGVEILLHLRNVSEAGTSGVQVHGTHHTAAVLAPQLVWMI